MSDPVVAHREPTDVNVGATVYRVIGVDTGIGASVTTVSVQHVSGPQVFIEAVLIGQDAVDLLDAIARGDRAAIERAIEHGAVT